MSVLSAAVQPWLIRDKRPRPAKAPVLATQVGPALVISPCGGRCASYSSARLILLLAHISAMASMAPRISGSTARRIAEKENSSADGISVVLPAILTERLEAFEGPPMAKERGVFSPEPGREG
jgi:hypothetical protein